MLKRKINTLLGNDKSVSKVSLEDAFSHFKENIDVSSEYPFASVKFNGNKIEFSIILETSLDLTTGDYTRFAKEDKLYILAMQKDNVIFKNYITNCPFNQEVYMSLETRIIKNTNVDFYIYLITDRKLAGRLILNVSTC